MSRIHRRAGLPLALSGAAALLTLAGGAGNTAFAATGSTTPPPLQVTLSACGTGSSAVWSAAMTPVLTIGTAPAGTCGAPAGSTYDPAHAKVSVDLSSAG